MSVYGKLNETDLIEQAQAIGQREQSMRFIVQLSRSTPAFNVVERTPEYEHFGCEARVWLIAHYSAVGSLDLRMDSESRIVKGLLQIIATALNGASRTQVQAYQLDAHFERLGLANYLTASRRDGLRAVVKHIKQG